MKAYLLYRDRDFDLTRTPPPYEEALVQDLELTTLFAAMSSDDKWLAEVIPKVVLASSKEVGTILYRQSILKDCLKRELVVRAIYTLAVEAIVAERKNFFGIGLRSPGLILHRSVEVLQVLVWHVTPTSGHRGPAYRYSRVIRFPADYFGWTGLGHQWKFVPVRRSWLSSSMQRWAMTASRSASVAK